MADKTTKYFEAVGRRKTSSARVRLYPSTNLSFEINGRKLEDYFLTDETRDLLRGVFADPNLSKFKITAKLSGGGVHSQAEAARHGIARALLLVDPSLRQVLRKDKLLTRDSRAKERRKFGLKKARKAPQWSKR